MSILTPIRLVAGFLLIAWLPGRLAWQTFGASSSTSLDFTERVFVSIFTSLLISAGLATFLAELGSLALGSMLVGLVLVCVAFAWAGGKLEIRDWRFRLNERIGGTQSPISILHSPSSNLQSLIPNLQSLISPWPFGLMALLILAVILFFRPAESVLVMDDASVYVIRGLTLARSGGLDTHDPALPALSSNAAHELLPFVQYESSYIRHEGAFYIWQWGRGLIRPSFFHLPSIWMAVLALIGGERAALWATPLAGLLSVAGLALLSRRLFGPAVGLAAALLLTLSFPQVWYARYPTSEMFMQAWLLGGLFLLTVYLQSRRRFAAVTAGLALGQLLLIRVDAVVAIFGIGLCFAGWILKDRRDQTQLYSVDTRWFCVPFGLTAGWAGLHAVVFASPYLMSLTHVFLTPRVGVIIALGVAVAAAVAVLVWYRPAVVRLRMSGLPGGTVSRWLAGLLVAGAWAVVWIVDPQAGMRFGAVRWLSWYLTPVGLVAALAGSILLIRRGVSRPAQVFLLIAVLYALLYLPNPRAYPAQPWGVRRFVPALLPALSVMMAYLAVRLPTFATRRVRRGISVVLVLVLALLLGSTLRPVLAHAEYAGVWGQVAALAEEVEPGAVVLFNQTGVGQAVAQPLTYLYGRPAFVLQTDAPNLGVIEEQMRRWIGDGRPVYLAVTGLAPWLADVKMGLEPAGDFTLRFPRLERPMDHVPRRSTTEVWPIELYRIVPDGGWRPVSRLEMELGELPYLRAGFYEHETAPDKTTFRWTDGDAEISLPVPEDVTRLTLRVSGPPPEVPRATLELFIDGRHAGAWELSDEFATLNAEVPAEAAEDGRLEVRLRSDVWVPGQSGLGNDDRRLGIAVDWIEVGE